MNRWSCYHNESASDRDNAAKTTTAKDHNSPRHRRPRRHHLERRTADSFVCFRFTFMRNREKKISSIAVERINIINETITRKHCTEKMRHNFSSMRGVRNNIEKKFFFYCRPTTSFCHARRWGFWAFLYCETNFSWAKRWLMEEGFKYESQRHQNKIKSAIWSQTMLKCDDDDMLCYVHIHILGGL